MGRLSAIGSLVAIALAVAGCGTSSAPPREAQPPARASGANAPPHGGRAIDLGTSHRAELVVDDTGMIVVRLYDSRWNLLDTAGKAVEVEIATPDGASRRIATEPMGVGPAAHFMAPMDEAVVAHVREQGGYVATVRARLGAQALSGSTQVTGLATGGKGM